MSLSRTDETNLVLPLFEGIFETPVWETFLRRLLQRTGAQRVRMTVRNGSAPNQPPLRRRVLADRFADQHDPGEPGPLDQRAYGNLRPNRVYTLDEMRDFNDAAVREEQDAVLAAAGIGDARLIRVAGQGELNAWIVLLHERPSFGAADSALLSALAPAMAVALAIYAQLGTLRLRAETAEESLALLGIGQALLDAEGHVLVADRLAQEALPLPAAGSRTQAAGQAQLAQACAAMANAPPATRAVVKLDGREGKDLLLRPARSDPAGLPHPAAAVASFRTGRREDAASAARVIARSMGLSDREAALAEAIGQGVPLVDAGRALQLTTETTRNYSKRIYAKTGAAGQADLVRMVLTGLAPLA